MKASSEQQNSLQVESALTVTQLNREARFLLEDNFPSVLVEGEISNIATPASGHWYLTLKDDRAQVRCAMFRNRNLRVRFKPKNGDQVLIKAKLSLYEGRGDYQLILESMEETGAGALRQAFETLKEKLFQEGLFDNEHKQEAPPLPKHIGVITSPTGAAIRDIISVLKRRFPSIPITVLPVSVQGETSASDIKSAIEVANKQQGCLHDLDVLIISRGGGSLEDLWSFNDEALARTIFNSSLPIISAVGHEIDFTIADFVADLRAATPSAAAELLSPDQQDYYHLMLAYEQQFGALMREKISQNSQQISWLLKQLRHPGRRLQEHAQKLDDIEARLKRALHNNLYRLSNSLQQLKNTLHAHSPNTVIKQEKQHVETFKSRLISCMQQFLLVQKHSLAEQSHALDTVSPLNTMSRGYSLVYTDKHALITHYEQVKPGDTIHSHLGKGKITSTVEKTTSTNLLSQKK